MEGGRVTESHMSGEVECVFCVCVLFRSVCGEPRNLETCINRFRNPKPGQGPAGPLSGVWLHAGAPLRTTLQNAGGAYVINPNASLCWIARGPPLHGACWGAPGGRAWWAGGGGGLEPCARGRMQWALPTPTGDEEWSLCERGVASAHKCGGLHCNLQGE